MPEKFAPGFSVIPDRLDLRDRVYTPRVSTAPPVMINSLDGLELPILAQANSNACTGFALATIVNLLMARADWKLKEPHVSPYMIYSMARRYDDIPGTEDSGSTLRGALKGWYKHGVCGASFWDGLEMPPTPDDPTKDWWLDAVNRPMGAYYRIEARSVCDLQLALAENGAVFASAFTHDNWHLGTHYNEPGLFEIPPGQGNITGAHAFAIIGYTEKGFILRNSWGSTWGSKGLAILSYDDWLDNCMDAWVVQLGVRVERSSQGPTFIQPPASTPEVAAAAGIAPTPKLNLSADTEERNHQLMPYIMDIGNRGRLSTTGNFRTSPDDLKALLGIYLPEFRKQWDISDGEPVDVGIFAHGGLNSEDAAADTAASWVKALYEKRIFPLFIMWETDAASTLRNILSDVIAPSQAPASNFIERSRSWINGVIESTVSAPGSALWNKMKENAEFISKVPVNAAPPTNDPIALQVLIDLMIQLQFDTKQIRLHLIGHSAGTIVHSHFSQLLKKKELPVHSLHYLAAAVTIETFEQTVLPILREGEGHLYLYQLSEKLEEDDLTCQYVLGYRGSLLYLVSNSFEKRRGTPLLGMQIYSKKAVGGWKLGDDKLTISTSPCPETASTTHGGFGRDKTTIAAVIDRIEKLRPVPAPKLSEPPPLALADPAGQ